MFQCFYKCAESLIFVFMSKNQKLYLAKALYCESTLTRKAIAEQVGVTEKTLRKWIDENNWDDLKNTRSITRESLLQAEYAQLEAINKIIAEEMNGVPSKHLSDAKGVIRKNIEALSSTPLFKYVEAFDDFTNWLLKNKPDLVKAVSAASYEFLESIAKTKK